MVDPALEFHPDRLRPLLKTASARSAMLDRSWSSWGIFPSLQTFPKLFFFFLLRCEVGRLRRLHHLRDRHVSAPQDPRPGGQHPVHVLRPVRVRAPLLLLQR